MCICVKEMKLTHLHNNEELNFVQMSPKIIEIKLTFTSRYKNISSKFWYRINVLKRLIESL